MLDMQLSRLYVAEDWYRYLIEDCHSIATQAYKRSSEELLRGYHEVGARILQDYPNFARYKIYGEKIASQVSQSMGKSKRTVERAIKFAQKYPDFEKIYALEEGEKINWHIMVNKYLIDSPKTAEELPEEEHYLICPNCSFKFKP